MRGKIKLGRVSLTFRVGGGESDGTAIIDISSRDESFHVRGWLSSDSESDNVSVTDEQIFHEVCSGEGVHGTWAGRDERSRHGAEA